MKTCTFTSVAATLILAASSTVAAPVTSSDTTLTAPFYLVTTSSADSSSNSSNLPSVSAISLFDPFHQPNFLLRSIGPGYLSLPNFTLTDGVLHVPTTGPFGTGNFTFNSIPAVAGTELQFVEGAQNDGGLSLVGGYLLAVNGAGEGWSLCSGSLGETVIQYMGTDPSCESTYIQAVNSPPY